MSHSLPEIDTRKNCMPGASETGTGFRRAMLYKRGLSRHAVSVRPSVCVSVTFVYSVKTNKDIFDFFHHLVATPF